MNHQLNIKYVFFSYFYNLNSYYFLIFLIISYYFKANPSPNNENGLSIAFGSCGHVFHLDCIQRWLKTRSVCPLCNTEWDFAKIEKIPGYGTISS